MEDRKKTEREVDRAYYAKNREEVLSAKRKYRQFIRRDVVTLLGGKCFICGYDKSPYALSVPEVKRNATVSYVAYWNDLQRRIIIEGKAGLSLICANCQIEKENE